MNLIIFQNGRFLIICNGLLMYWIIIKILLSFFTLILIPIYWYFYGFKNFLWLSDIGLFLTVLALWSDSVLLMSIAAVEMFFFELVWNLDFYMMLFFNVSKIKLADYMFDSQYPVGLRLLSLFHVFLPIIWILYLYSFGYDANAIYYVIVLFWIILFFSYFFTDPSQNINWVFWPKMHNIKISQFTWLIILFITFPLLDFLPTHHVFLKLFNVIH